MGSRRQILIQQAKKLLAKGTLRTPDEQNKLNGILLNLEGLDLKITSSDPNINSQVSQVRKKRKVKNQQLVLNI